MLFVCTPDFSLTNVRTVDGTINIPSRDNNMRHVSKILHRHITEGGTNGQDERSEFDIDNFLAKSYNVMLLPFAKAYPSTLYVQKENKKECPTPSVKDIYRFVRTIFTKLQLSTECIIISLIYIERLMDVHTTALRPRNWRPLVLSAILTASKGTQHIGVACSSLIFFRE